MTRVFVLRWTWYPPRGESQRCGFSFVGSSRISKSALVKVLRVDPDELYEQSSVSLQFICKSDPCNFSLGGLGKSGLNIQPVHVDSVKLTFGRGIYDCSLVNYL